MKKVRVAVSEWRRLTEDPKKARSQPRQSAFWWRIVSEVKALLRRQDLILHSARYPATKRVDVILPRLRQSQVSLSP